IHKRAKAVGDNQACAATDRHQDYGFEEELAEDGFASRTQSFAHAYFARTLAHADQHDVHYTEAAQKNGGHAHGAHKHFHADEDHPIGLSVLDRIPDAGGLIVTRIEIVQTSKRATELANAVRMRFE